MEKLRTDYVDFGFIHCIDEERDLDTYLNNGVLDAKQSPFGTALTPFLTDWSAAGGRRFFSVGSGA